MLMSFVCCCIVIKMQSWFFGYCVGCLVGWAVRWVFWYLNSFFSVSPRYFSPLSPFHYLSLFYNNEYYCCRFLVMQKCKKVFIIIGIKLLFCALLVTVGSHVTMVGNNQLPTISHAYTRIHILFISGSRIRESSLFLSSSVVVVTSFFYIPGC